MWEVKGFKGNLPSGFRLMEDEDNVFLYHREERVAIFSLQADPKEIENAAMDYKNQVLQR